MPSRKKSLQQVRVECYRLSDKEVADLIKRLGSHPAIEGVARAARMGSGEIELGTLFFIYIAPFLIRYAGTKALDFVTDEVKDWFKHRRRKSGFIILNLHGKQTRIGKGKPKRYPLGFLP